MNVPISRSTTHRRLKPPLLTIWPALPESEEGWSAISRDRPKNRNPIYRPESSSVRILPRCWRERGVEHMNEPLFSCLHEFGTNGVSNQARSRVYVELAHSGRSVRLR